MSFAKLTINYLKAIKNEFFGSRKISIQEGQENILKYKIGNIKYHNTTIDGLMPQLVEIGDNFISAPGSVILTHDASTYLHIRKHRVEKTILGNNVFLGLNAVIMPGVKVGDGAIIGAGAIVTKNVEPFTVVAGNPAKKICTVKEYLEKCEVRNVLFETPKSFEKIFSGDKIMPEEIVEFQKKYFEKHD